MHKPYEKEYAGADTVVIFTHGFMGSPTQFEDLADIAYQHKCSALALLLPGHGGTSKEFTKYRLHHWERHLENEIQRMSHVYKNIILVGHSMGGLLSLNAGLNKNFNIKSIMLISSPLKLRYSLDKVRTGIKLHILSQQTKDDEISEVYKKSNSIEISSILNCFSWSRQMADVYKLMSKTKSNLPAITIPTTIIHSQNDETVSSKTLKIFSTGFTSAHKIVTLDESRHAFYPPGERTVILRELACLIAGLDLNQERKQL
ncbi:MAG: alpha/beta fold hydrolase [Oscillospiraceae bacterium]|nr:alpha/beta fold hydrolase [Oscillospiraceae bacterium]